MRLTVNIQNGVDPVDYPRLRDAAVRGVRNLVVAHLLARQGTARHRPGMPQSGYWGDAANATTVEMHGGGGVVTVSKEGVALHFYGGVVRPGPGKKALAFPVHPAAAGMRAAEYDPRREKLEFVPGAGGRAPTLRDAESGEVYYVLIASKTFRPDPSVLPAESEMTSAAVAAMEAARC